MAGHPQHRRRFNTDLSLLKTAASVPLVAPIDRTVLYGEDIGARRAAAFVQSHPSYMRLDDLLQQTQAGKALLAALLSRQRTDRWNEVEEVWWELSWRLARGAKGVVHIFGPDRFMRDQPLSSFKHKYTTGAYANSVLEKVELPELEANLAVTDVYFNGKRLV